MRHSSNLDHGGAAPVVATALAVALFTGSALAQSARQDFVLVNRTGYELSEIYVSQNNSNEWGNDILGKSTVPDGNTVNVRFSSSATACLWDLKVTYSADDSSAVWRSIDLCRISKITIRYNRSTDKTSASFD
jgi:hypothetical protein